ncbi:MAG: hypothetical protein M9933_10260 [Chitinophagaceae bacterium]|nr:hypothetical protein [Chitinophagaceae bacterium]
MKPIPSGLLFIKAKTASYLSELTQAKRVFSLKDMSDKEGLIQEIKKNCQS